MFVRQCQCPPAVISYFAKARLREAITSSRSHISDNRNCELCEGPSCRCPYKPPWANYTLLLKFLLYGFVLYFQAASSLRLHCSVALNALLYILECAGTTVGFDEEKLTLTPTSTIDPTCGHLLFALFKTTTNTIPYSIYMDSTWPNYIRFGTELTWGRVVLQGPTWPTGTTWFGDEVTVTWTQAPKFAIF